MIRGDYIHHGLPEKHKNTPGRYKIGPNRTCVRRGLWGVCGMENSEVAMKIWPQVGPRGVTRDV